MKIIADSHLDHGLTPAHLAWLARIGAPGGTVTVMTLTLPDELPALTYALYGPAMGDACVWPHEVTWLYRGERKWESRLVPLPARETRLVTLVTGPHDDEPCVLYTAYGGPAAPREPGDPSLRAECDECYGTGRTRTGPPLCGEEGCCGREEETCAGCDGLGGLATPDLAESEAFWAAHALARPMTYVEVKMRNWAEIVAVPTEKPGDALVAARREFMAPAGAIGTLRRGFGMVILDAPTEGQRRLARVIRV